MPRKSRLNRVRVRTHPDLARRVHANPRKRARTRNPSVGFRAQLALGLTLTSVNLSPSPNQAGNLILKEDTNVGVSTRRRALAIRRSSSPIVRLIRLQPGAGLHEQEQQRSDRASCRMPMRMCRVRMSSLPRELLFLGRCLWQILQRRPQGI